MTKINMKYVIERHMQEKYAIVRKNKGKEGSTMKMKNEISRTLKHMVAVGPMSRFSTS